MIVKNHKAFADPDEALPFNINTLATIKTDGEPVYSRMRYSRDTKAAKPTMVKWLLSRNKFSVTRDRSSRPIIPC